MPLDGLISQLATHVETGLSTAEATKRLKHYGANELAAVPPVTAWQIFISQFQSLVVWILLVAAVISGLTADWLDAAAIVAVVLLNAMLGFFQEGRAEQAIAGLRKLIFPTAKVYRDGQLVSLAARELVPGDIIQLEAGDHVPADARLLQSSSLRLQEAVLTGESVPLEKDAQATLAPKTPLAERTNLIFMSCTVAAGSGRAVVVKTGMRTEIGHIAGLLDAHERKPTPLQRELESVGRTLAMLCLAIVAVVFLLSLWRGDRLWNGLMTAISLAVAAVPEGLPAVVTVTLALGLQRMVRRNALIRKLHSVETLGSVTVICSDKTGTLTRNEMTVREVLIAEGRYHVTGAGYEPTGDFLRVDDSDVDKSSRVERKDLPESLLKTLRIGAVCNNARLAAPADSDDWRIVGDPMEGALIVVAQKADALLEPSKWKVLEELPFDSERKMMSVLVCGSEQGFQLFTKGAPESILANCHAEFIDGESRPLSDDRRRELLGYTEEMAGRALRVLACAFRHASHRGDLEESELTLAGLVGIIDPPREEVRDAIALCREAGIRTVMITGDHPTTAVAIGKELGLLSSPEAVRTGAQLDGVADPELPSLVTQTDIYARVTPAHKLRIVSALQNQGNVVAMTGDGVNDAPAVKTADIGVAMGRTGTDVTREAAAMVLLDDNFTSIVSAVEEGRAIYDNIRKILDYLLSCNLGEMLLMLFAALIGWPSPLVPIQLLWINLVTDGLPAFALAMEEAEPELMRRGPLKTGTRMLSWQLGRAVLVQGVFLAMIGLIALWFGMRNTGNAEHARSLVFNAVVSSQLFRVLAARSTRLTFWQLGVVTNPYVFAAVVISILLHFSLMNWPAMHAVFEVTHHSLNEWLFVVCAALVPVTLLESYKLVNQGRKSSR